MKTTGAIWISIIGLSACFVLGCETAPRDSHVDQHWGEALQLNMSAMIANPEAGSSEPVEGLDPATAQEVADRYYESQEQRSSGEVRTLLVTE
jgi:type IV pilus biogenesis protein CpaD/CtpE